jgi:hypothetical protein
MSLERSLSVQSKHATETEQAEALYLSALREAAVARQDAKRFAGIERPNRRRSNRRRSSTVVEEDGEEPASGEVAVPGEPPLESVSAETAPGGVPPGFADAARSSRGTAPAAAPAAPPFFSSPPAPCSAFVAISREIGSKIVSTVPAAKDAIR